MLYNYLSSTEKRSISSCNFNQHICSRHPDRTMQEHDIIYIRDGSWTIAQDGIDYNLAAGDVILLQSGHHHYGPIPCDGAVSTSYIHFSRNVGDSLEEKKEQTGNAYAFPMVVHCKEKPIIEKYFSRVIHAFWEEDYYEKEKAAAYLELLLCELSEADAKKHYVVDEIKLHIKKNPGRFIPNEEFANMFHCSVRTLSSKFKAHTGCSIHAWQLQIKCRMADELMQYDPTITLKEVAATYGFYDEYHFGKCFKKIMGRSPKKAK